MSLKRINITAIKLKMAMNICSSKFNYLSFWNCFAYSNPVTMIFSGQLFQAVFFIENKAVLKTNSKNFGADQELERTIISG